MNPREQSRKHDTISLPHNPQLSCFTWNNKHCVSLFKAVKIEPYSKCVFGPSVRNGNTTLKGSLSSRRFASHPKKKKKWPWARRQYKWSYESCLWRFSVSLETFENISHVMWVVSPMGDCSPSSVPVHRVGFVGGFFFFFGVEGFVTINTWNSPPGQ